MRSKLLFLMLIVLLAFAYPVSAELSPAQKAFDAGGTWELNGWSAWGSGSGSGPSGYSWRSFWAYIDETGTGSDGGNFMALPIADDGWYENWNWDYNVTYPLVEHLYALEPGQSFTIGAFFKDLDGPGSNNGSWTNAYFGFEWLDANGEWCCGDNPDQQGDVGPRYQPGFQLDPAADWTYYEETAVAPWGTVSIRPTFGHWGGDTDGRGTEPPPFDLSGGVIGVDEVWMDYYSKLGLAYDPTPRTGAQGVDPATTLLEWKRFKLCWKTFKNELWWGGSQSDPNTANFWNIATKIMDLADVNDFDLGDAIGGAISLDPGNYYSWGVKYDPNACDDDEINLREGAVWTFDTINRPPVVDAGLHHERWQDGSASPIKIDIEASYTDDGLKAGGPITYAWTETLANGATIPTYEEGRDEEDPNVTFSTAGDYVLTLTINDGEIGSDGDDSILIRIFGNAEDRLRAHYQLDGNTTDIEEGHPATVVDNPTWGVGQVIGAVELDGTDDLLSDGLNDSVQIDDTGSDPNFQADTWENSDLIDGMTVSAWMKLDEDGWSTTWEAIVAKNNSSWELGRNAGNDTVRFVVQEGIGDAVSSGATDVTSGWHQVVGVYDRNTIKIYVDGLLGSDPTDAGTLDLQAERNFDKDGQPINTQDWQVPKAAGKVRIGAGSNVSAAGEPEDLAFAGLIDQVRIFDAAVPWRAEHSGTPGIVEMYRADDGHDNCGGVYLVGDTNEDCYITLADFALVALDWLDCNDVAEEDCPLWHHEE